MPSYVIFGKQTAKRNKSETKDVGTAKEENDSSSFHSLQLKWDGIRKNVLFNLFNLILLIFTEMASGQTTWASEVADLRAGNHHQGRSNKELLEEGFWIWTNGWLPRTKSEHRVVFLVEVLLGSILRCAVLNMLSTHVHTYNTLYMSVKPMTDKRINHYSFKSGNGASCPYDTSFVCGRFHIYL